VRTLGTVSFFPQTVVGRVTCAHDATCLHQIVTKRIAHSDTQIRGEWTDEIDRCVREVWKGWRNQRAKCQSQRGIMTRGNVMALITSTPIRGPRRLCGTHLSIIDELTRRHLPFILESLLHLSPWLPYDVIYASANTQYWNVASIPRNLQMRDGSWTLETLSCHAYSPRFAHWYCLGCVKRTNGFGCERKASQSRMWYQKVIQMTIWLNTHTLLNAVTDSCLFFA